MTILKLVFLILCLTRSCIRCLYYDGLNTYSIYPRLDLQICSNSSLSFDFTLSSISNNTRVLLYSEQQIQISTVSKSKKLINSYFLIKQTQMNRLIINDYWNINEIQIQLPKEYQTLWFRFVYQRVSNQVYINLYKFETTSTTSSSINRIPAIKLINIFSKQFIHSNFVLDEFDSSDESSSIDTKQVTYSKLFVGGVGENLNLDNNLSLNQLKQYSKFNGYIMNLQYTSLSSQCSIELCTKQTLNQRQYAIFSNSPSKQFKLSKPDSITIDDICESDTLTHDICPKDCSCLSNNFVAPYFNCDCPEPTNQLNIKNTKQKCSSLYKSFAINFDDANYFENLKDKVDYPILPSFTKIEIQNLATQFDKLKGIQFRNTVSRLSLAPKSEIAEQDSCFWNIEDCSSGFTQHIVMSIDRLDEKKYNLKVLLFQNGQSDMSKFVAFIYKNRLHFSVFEHLESQEWLVSSFQLDKNKHINKQFKITITWLRDKYLSLHIDGFLVDMSTKPSSPPVNQDVYQSINSPNRFYYEFGIKLIQTDKNILINTGSSLLNHQFTIKYLRRDYYNDLDVQDSKIIVSSPLPSEIIRIDNTQRVMYKIDSPLTGVTTETIELSFRTNQPDGVIFYIRNNPIITYLELVRGQPVVVVDNRVKNFYLRPQTAPLNDNEWHEIKLHRDGQTISINIDSQYHDMSELGSQSNQILTGGYVYLGLADPNNINLSDKKTFVGEMVRGKVTINNVPQKVIQQPYYWPSLPIQTTNQTVNIDTSQLTSQDGKMINIVINVYGPPGLIVNAGQKQETETHLIYLDNLPDTRYISVGLEDKEIDFRFKSIRLDSFMIKFQTRQTCGQLITLVNDNRNYIGLEVYEGYLYSSANINGNQQRFQISRIRVDDGRIYQINIKQEQQKLMCWLDADDSYKQSIQVSQSQTVLVNTIRVAGQDGTDYGFSSKFGFVGCIGAIILNDRDVIDYQVVPTERRQSCQQVIHQPATTTPAPTTPVPTPPAPVSLGYISFSGTIDILTYNYIYDHEKPAFEDISFIFRTVVSNGVLFSAHNNEENYNQILIGAYIKDGLVHVVYKNYTFTQDLYFENTVVDDGNLYRLNIRRNSNGHGFIQLQSYVGVTALDFYTQPGQIRFSKIIVGGADDWSRIKFFGHRNDFVGCIIDLFQVNGNSVIRPADIPKERYNCNVERPAPATTVTVRTTTQKPRCLPDGYPLSFSSVDDALTYQHETLVCEHIHIPFRTRDPRGIIYSHSSEDGTNYILVYLRRGFVNIIVRDNNGEKDLELDSVRVDDGELHKLDIHCESAGYLIAYIDQNRQVSSNRVELYSPIMLNSYTLGYYNTELLSSRYSQLDNFRGCLEQVQFNKECLIYEIHADRNRLTCSVQPLPPVSSPAPTKTRKPSCLNTCQHNDNECVFETDSRGYIVYNANEANVQASSSSRDSIRFNFKVTNLKDQEQDLLSVYHPERSIRVYLSSSEILIDFKNYQTIRPGKVNNLNDGKWHRFVLEQFNRDLIIRVDDSTYSETIPFDFDLYGSGTLHFGSSHGKEANNLHGYLKDVFVKYSNVEYDLIASAKDIRIPGVSCEGHVVLKSHVESSQKLRCVSDPVTDSSNECQTDGVCYASLWRNSSGVVERYMRCFNREQLQPPENPVLCRSQDLTRYVIQCCDTDYCNRDLELKLKDLDEKDERSIWRFRGPNSGDIEFIPYLQPAKQSELVLQYNTSKLEGTIMCTRDEYYALRTELKDQRVLVSLIDIRSKRALKSGYCQQRSGSQLNDNKWHKVQMVKKSRSQISISCDDSSSFTLQHEIDIPFVNTNNYGVLFGSDCVGDKLKNFNGDLSQIVYTHDGKAYSFDDLQYSEDPRFTYENYVEFRPKYISEVYSDPKPIFFRSSKSSARLDKWDDSKVGRISFEFKVEIQNEDGILFSTQSADSYFAISINNGYLETILSPYRVPYADSSSKIVYYDRFQRLFPHPNSAVNDGEWHKLEFMMLGDSIGSFVLDDDFTSKLRFPINYWNEESPIVFGNNLDIKRDSLESFRGCIRNIVINNRLINWYSTGALFNIEAGCYNYRYEPNQLLFLQGQQIGNDLTESPNSLQFNQNGCLRFNPKTNNEKETVEFLFKTGGDHEVLFDSVGTEFLIHTQGPSLVIRSKDDSNVNTVMERGVYFNDNNWHKLKLEKTETMVKLELDSKYKKEFMLTRRNRFGPVYFGCVKDKSKLKLRFDKIKNFDGQMQNVVYTSSNGQETRIDLINNLNQGEQSLLVDGSLQWSLGSKSNANNNKQNENSISFRELNSYLKLDNLNFDSNSNLSFWFKTNENDGLLALVAPSVSSGSNQQSLSLISSNYLAVELVNGSVSLVVNSGGQLERVSCSPSKQPNSLRLNDNKWHQIQIKRDRLGNSDSSQPSSSITFSCDNNYVRVKVSDLNLNSVQFNTGNLTLNQNDQLPSDLWLSKNSKYLGCLKEFKLNNRLVNLYESTTTESRSTLENSCQDSSNQCRNSKCLNQGECVEGFGRSYCNCDSTQFTGSKCDQPASTLSFNGSHTVEYITNLQSSSAEDLSLRFRTGLRNGVLFALKKANDEPSLVVSIEDGRLKCVYDRKNNDKSTYVGETNFFNNNKWHTVHLKRNGQYVQLEIIDNQKVRYYVVDDLGDDFKSIEYQSVSIGGAKSPSLLQEHPNFIGWIQNVRFNSDELLQNYLTNRLGSQYTSINGYADPGETSLLLHHQITFTSPCPITLPRGYSGERFNIHLFFKTSQENGVILFRRGKEYRFMALEIRSGKLRFVFDLGGGIKEASSSFALNDLNWHEVTVKRFDRQKFSVRIDDLKEIYVDIGTNSPPLSELESFTIGGVIPDHQKFDKDVLGSEGFVGCLASVEINHDAANLYSDMLNLCPSVQRGCVDLSCSSESCANNGVCTSTSNQVTCNCEMTSYTGPFCRDNSNFYFFGKNNKECGMIKYTINPPLLNRDNDRLAFGFTTTDSDAVLSRIEGDYGQYFEIKLINGLLNINININDVEEKFIYSVMGDKKFNDNTYHVVQYVRENSLILFRVDNFEQVRFNLQSNVCVFRSQKYVYVGAVEVSSKFNNDCYYGIMAGMFFNGHYILDQGIKSGDVGIVDYRYIMIEIDINRNRTRPLLSDQSCPLGYSKNINVCVFVICPLNSDQIADTCTCYQGFYEQTDSCIKRNETVAPIVDASAKLIPAKTRSLETPIGLILGIISGIALALLAAGIGARKCSDGLCVPPPKAKGKASTANQVATMISSTTNTTNQSYDLNTVRREEVPLIEQNTMRQEEYMARDQLDMGYSYYPPPPPPGPIFTQSVNETMEMYEQTLGGAGGTTTVTTIGPTTTVAYNTSGLSQAAHHTSHRDLAMSSMFFSQNNAAEYELSNVTCVTMTPNGKYAIIGQSVGTPQIWDTISGQLIRSMNGTSADCSQIDLACNGSLLVTLANDGGANPLIKALQIWEVQTGVPIQMSHQIKCCVFALSNDTNSIYMASNQRFGNGVSVGVLDLVTYELTKEVKSDPNLSLGENPDSILLTPDERFAIVGCRLPSGTNFVVFDLTKASEIALTKSIAFDADPKCTVVLSNNEVITGTRGGHLIQWNINTCQITTTFVDPSETNAHIGPINQLCISSDKEHIVSASSDGTVKIWNTSNKNLVSVLSGHRGEVTCVSISNNDLIVTGSTDQTVGLWRLYGGNQISSMTVGMNLIEVYMARHNKTIVAIGEKDGEQQLLMLRVVNVQR